MRKLSTSKFFHLLLFFTLLTSIVYGQRKSWSHYDTTGYFTREVIAKRGYTLVFVNLDSAFSRQVKKGLIATFFKVYPKEVKTFNPSSPAKVTFIIDPEYDGIAATSRATVRFNPAWFKSHPEDIDVVTHEAMHIVQGYHFGHTPGWLTEGIADYARYEYGVNNKAAGWTLPDYRPKQSYKNAYRITARFLVWLDKNVKDSIVPKIDAALRKGVYKEDIWKELTGKSLDQLWQSYSESPALELSYR